MFKHRKSYWIQRTHIIKADEYECSSCGYRSDTAYEVCPRCYARMNGGQYDPTFVDELELLDDIF